MENKILYINACVRQESRTQELAEYLLDMLDGEKIQINLYNEKLSPVDAEALEKRHAGDFSDESFDYAKQFAKAHTIVIAAPFWDLSFPAVLKTYFENITVSGITFEYSDNGRPVGKCKAKKLYYVTTSGGYIGENNYGFEYIKALAKNFFGIGEVYFFAAEGLDIFGADVQKIMEETKASITKYEVKL